MDKPRRKNKKGAGRPSQGFVRKHITMHPTDWERAAKLGNGCRSAGVRKAIEEAS